MSKTNKTHPKKKIIKMPNIGKELRHTEYKHTADPIVATAGNQWKKKKKDPN